MNSIWSQMTKLPHYPALEQDLHVHTLVIGGGLTGLLCGFFLQEQDADYALIEQHEIAGHVTANTTAKITTQHGLIYSDLLRYQGKETAQGYYIANQDALDKFRQVIKDYAIDCDFETQTNLIYDLHNRQEILDELTALHEINAKGIYVERPENFPLEIKAAVETPNQAQFHPLKFAREIAELQKGHIYEETKALDIDKEKDGYVIKVANPYIVNQRVHQIFAKRVIIATHFPFKNFRGLYFMKMHQARSYAMLLSHIAPEKLPKQMAMGAQSGDLSFRTAQKEKLILGGRGGKTGKDHGGFTQLAADAKKLFPGCTIEKLWATQDCMTLDKIPYIGNYLPDFSGVKVATGFNKWGMTSAMAAALMLTDQMDREVADVFYPHRSMIHPQVVVNAATSLANLLKLKGPRCSHMGCSLKWNKSEQSWDCPCHGSRYDKDGKVLNEPAQKDITKTLIT